MRGWVAVALCLSACEGEPLEVVGTPTGDVYQPGGQCSLNEGGAGRCPLGRQFGFESRNDNSFAPDSPTLSDAKISCLRPYCGAGSLQVHAVYRWNPTSGVRIGTIEHKFPQPVDLLDKEVSFRLFIRQKLPVAQDGFTTPMNAQLAIVHNGQWRQVFDGPLSSKTSWHTIGGVVAPENKSLKLSDGTLSVMVTELKLQVYLATAVRGGDVWEGDLFFDEIGWE